MTAYDRSRAFIYRNARPLDLARWRYAFEDGPREDVLTALAAYQNADGGFGHALEADCWNPDSSPIQTWKATEILGEIGMDEPGHPVVRGILRYLASGADFDGHLWPKYVPGNNDHPGAPWWRFDPEQTSDYNPTAALAGFILRFADRESGLYALGCRIAREACAHLMQHPGQTAMHTIACYVQLYGDLQRAKADVGIDLPALAAQLSAEIGRLITRDVSVWAADYVCKPSLFITGKDSPFYAENRDVAEAECRFIERTQERDGTWAITWQWDAYPEAWAVSKNWWKSDVIIGNLRFLKAIQE